MSSRFPPPGGHRQQNPAPQMGSSKVSGHQNYTQDPNSTPSPTRWTRVRSTNCVTACACVLGGKKQVWVGVQRGPGGPHRHTSITPQPKELTWSTPESLCVSPPKWIEQRGGREPQRLAEASVWARDFSEHTVHGNNRRGVCAISLGARIAPQHCSSPCVTGWRAPKVTLGSFLFVLSVWSPRAVT